jgi:two-component system, cell cycle response regulator DivK
MHPDAPAGSTPVVLVVDDFDDAREMYSEYLAHAGYHVETAGDGAQGVRIARSVRPDVVVMDLAMPVMDGWTATRELRRYEETRGTVVIALTGHGSDSTRRLAMEAGCDDFVEKPCLPQELHRKIRTHLAHRQV